MPQGMGVAKNTVTFCFEKDVIDESERREQ
jgi:hypothetical protein